MRLVVASLGLVAVAATGCSSEAAAPPPLPVVASPTAAPVPSPPALAAEESIEGVEAFVRHYLDVVDEAYGRGEASLVADLSSPECDGCAEIVADIKGLAAKGQRLQGGQATVLSVAVPPIDANGPIVSVTVRTADARIVDAGGGTVQVLPARERVNLQMRVVREEAVRWVLRGYRVADS